ncbi:MAG: hemerythrin [Thiomicrorhabdus sp.]|nr:MAG: hemerythrin [Thiomicrorhabdus sp.]
MIDFDDVPRVELDFMNDDHEEATALVNHIQHLLILIETGEAKAEETGKTLEALLKHNQEHFAREEEQMQKFSFPPYSIHKGEHERVLAEMETEIAAWQADKDIARLKLYIEETLPNWFVGHIETMDTMTAMFIARSGG